MRKRDHSRRKIRKGFKEKEAIELSYKYQARLDLGMFQVGREVCKVGKMQSVPRDQKEVKFGGKLQVWSNIVENNTSLELKQDKGDLSLWHSGFGCYLGDKWGIMVFREKSDNWTCFNPSFTTLDICNLRWPRGHFEVQFPYCKMENIHTYKYIHVIVLLQGLKKDTYEHTYSGALHIGGLELMLL